MDYIRAIERQQIREDIPTVLVGDNVKVHYRIKEGEREREQVFQGDVIRMSGAGARETSPSARSASASASSVPSPCTAPRLPSSRLSVTVTCTAPSFTTCATASARPPAFARSAKAPQGYAAAPGDRGGFLCRKNSRQQGDGHHVG